MLSKISQNQKYNLVSSHMDNLNFNIHLCVYMYVCFYMRVFVGHKTTKGRGYECGKIVLILYALFSMGGSVGVRGPAGVYALFPLRGGWGCRGQRTACQIPFSLLSCIPGVRLVRKFPNPLSHLASLVRGA